MLRHGSYSLRPSSIPEDTDGIGQNVESLLQ